MKPKKKKGGKVQETEAAIEAVVERSVSSEALRSVFSIFLIAFGGFLILALAGGAGTVGAVLYQALSWLLGVGYVLLPVSFFLLAVIILRSIERKFGWVQVVSICIFLLSALGLIGLAFPTKGGTLGELIAQPFQTAFGITGTVFFLLAFIIASLVIAFDVHLMQVFDVLQAVRARRKAQQALAPTIAETPITGLPLAGEEPDPEPQTEVEDEPEMPPAPRQAPPPPKPTPADGFPVIAATWSAYVPPPLSILGKNKGKPEVGDIKANMNIIKRTLQNFGIQVEMDEASIGPTVTRYSMKPAEGVRLSKILALQSNLELALAVSPIRIEAPIPGKSLVGSKYPTSHAPC